MHSNKNEQTISEAGVSTQSSVTDKQNKQKALEQNKDKLLEYIRKNVIGNSEDTVIQTVYGEVPLVYGDYTASGKSLKFIEDYITSQVMPMYANSHSLQSGTGKQTIRAREESRHIIKRVCGADELDVCIFTGTGSTSAVNLCVHKLRLQEICQQVQNSKENPMSKEEIDEQVKNQDFCEKNRWHTFTCKLCKVILPSLGAYEKHAQQDIHLHNVENVKNQYVAYTQRPVVFHSVFEHNANLLPWRETGAEMVMIPQTENGDFDYEYLQNKLNEYRSYKTLKVCTMSAGSNLTGIIFDVDRISVMSHKAGFLACFDYAAVSPYQDINMNGLSQHGQSSFAQIP